MRVALKNVLTISQFSLHPSNLAALLALPWLAILALIAELYCVMPAEKPTILD